MRVRLGIIWIASTLHHTSKTPYQRRLLMLSQPTTLPQVHELLLELTNVGGNGLIELCAISTHPASIAIGIDRAKMFAPDGREVTIARYGSQPRVYQRYAVECFSCTILPLSHDQENRIPTVSMTFICQQQIEESAGCSVQQCGP